MEKRENFKPRLEQFVKTYEELNKVCLEGIKNASEKGDYEAVNLFVQLYIAAEKVYGDSLLKLNLMFN